MTNNIYERIEAGINDRIVKRSVVGGGCISKAERLIMKSGHSFFLKSGNPGKLFFCEANGLEELNKPAEIRIPKVHLVGEDYILLENISSGIAGKNFFQSFGQQFAGLHRFHGENFGFYEDNFIGSSPQINKTNEKESKNWTEFFLNKRLLFQLHLAEKNGYVTDKLRKGFHLLENSIESILSGCEEKPSLLHGDLWSGNFLCDESGNPVLIDPAVYYGHREADLAMTRLFGGFPQEFYDAYNEEYPLKEGASYRQNLYMLYHVMNHLNLFGRSYYPQAERLLWGYL
jgi:protein-ribulosamine 3-kinase